MGLDNDIEYAMKGLLKNPILSVLRDIKIASILKQSNLITSFPDGTGYINSDYTDAVLIAENYASKIWPAYGEWTSDVSVRLFELSLEDIIDLGKDVIEKWADYLIEKYGEDVFKD